MTKFKEHQRVLSVPIFDAKLWLIVTNNVYRSRKNREQLFGPVDGETFCGLCSYQDHRFGLIFERRYLCHALIAHEIFHMAHRILERCGVKFGTTNHEPFSHMVDWLTDLVYRELKRGKIGVHLTWVPRKLLPNEPKDET